MPELRAINYGLIDKPGSEQSETLYHLNTLYDKADQFRQQQMSEWEQNALFLVGNQWERVEWDNRLRASRKISPPKDPRKSYAVSNFTVALSRQALSAFRGKLGRCIAIPASNDPEDEYAAEIGTDLLYAFYDFDNQEEKQFQAVSYAGVCGRCLLHPHWDSDATGTTLPSDYYSDGRIPGLGEIVTDVLSPLRYHVEPWAETFNDAKWVILSDIRDIEEVKALFPQVNTENLKGEDVQETTQLLDQLIANVSNAPGMRAPERKEVAILKRLHFRPTRRWPRGRVFWFTKSQLLEVTDLPDGIFAFVPYDWFPVALRQNPLPFISMIREDQVIHNKQLSQLLDLANNQLRGDVIVATGSQDIRQEIDPKTGQKRIYVPPDAKFELMRYDLNATNAQMLLEHSYQAAQRNAGVNDPSMARVPSGVKSGIAISLLQSKDTQGLSLFQIGFQSGNERVGKIVLQLAKKHYEMPRLVSVVGNGKLQKSQFFTGAELRNTKDVRTRNIPMLTEVEQQQVRQEAQAAGLYGPYANINDQVAKCRALLNTRLPGIEDEVEEINAPFGGWEEAKKIAGQRMALQTQMEMQGMAIQMAMAQNPQLTAGGQPGQPQPALAGAG